jgi:hypothetical protein
MSVMPEALKRHVGTDWLLTEATIICMRKTLLGSLMRNAEPKGEKVHYAPPPRPTTIRVPSSCFLTLWPISKSLAELRCHPSCVKLRINPADEKSQKGSGPSSESGRARRAPPGITQCFD